MFLVLIETKQNVGIKKCNTCYTKETFINI